MGRYISLRERRQRAQQDLRDIFQHPENTLVIHYASEDLRQTATGASPRIAAIGIHNLGRRTDQLFTAGLVAERLQIPVNQIQAQYATVERRMLDDFYDFVRRHENHRWVHWNMSSPTFGFAALEHRYQVLEGQPAHIPDAQKVDLNWTLIGIYGSQYVRDRSRARFEILAQRNGIETFSLLPGDEEAERFRRGEYQAISQSVERKTHLIARIAHLAYEGRLKTEASWWEGHGPGVRAFVEYLEEHPVMKWITLVVTIAGFVGLVLGLLKIF